MLRRPLNSVALSTITHRKPERVFDGTSTQVKAQMINKCRIKMVQGEIYNVKDPHEVGIGEIEKEHCSDLNYICTQL